MKSGPAVPGFTTLRVEVSGGVGRVELARPERLNALSPTLLDELTDELTDELDAESLAWAQRLAQRPLHALPATRRRFADVVERLSPAAGSEGDADALLAAYADPQTQDAQRRYLRQRGRG